uniref:Uncharacterized protein n=1 Tax=Larimichthys crocea TaxID=215358 RepID=A0A0F8AK73_LARCR
MQRVVRSMHGTKDTDEIMKQMRKDVSKVLLEKGETEKSKGPLGKLFWAEAKVARKEQETAAEEEKKGGWLKKGKNRDAQREAEQDNLSDLQAQLLKMQIAKTKQELKKTEKPSSRTASRDSRLLSRAPLGATAPTFAATIQRRAVSEGEGRMERGARKGWKRNEGLVSAFSKQVTSQQEAGKHTPPPEAEWVLLRVTKRKWSEPRWTGPFQVTERTSHAVRLRGKGDTWFHWSQCAAAEEPQRSLSEIQTNLQEKSTESADSETDPTSTKGAE